MPRSHILSNTTKAADLERLTPGDLLKFAMDYGEQAGMSSETIEGWRAKVRSSEWCFEELVTAVMASVVKPIQAQLAADPRGDRDTLASIAVSFRNGDTVRPAVIRQQLARKGYEATIEDGSKVVVKVSYDNIAAVTAILQSTLKTVR